MGLSQSFLTNGEMGPGTSYLLLFCCWGEVPSNKLNFQQYNQTIISFTKKNMFSNESRLLAMHRCCV